MTNLLKDDLIGLKSRLENIEKEFEEKLKDVETKESKFRKMDEQIDELVNSKDSIIKLNIGGKVFQTKISTLLSKKDTLFYKIICTRMDMKEEINTEIFFDRSFIHFPLILDYLRTGKYSLKGYSKFDIDDIGEEIEFYGLTEIMKIIEEMRKEIEIVAMDAAPRYSTAGTHSFEDLKDRSCMKGVCVQSPYHIILELNFEHEISGIEVAGWAGNSGLWYVGNGSGAKIYTSIDKSTWTDVGTLTPLTGTITTITLRPSLCKFIKFQHTSYVGLGFLNFIKTK
jgi:soluble cytochrome b562